MATKMTVEQQVKRLKLDGWNNLLTGQGTTYDKKTYTTFSAKNFLDEFQLLDLYVDDGFAKRVVDLVPDEMLRAGFTVDNDPDEYVEARLEEIAGMKEIERLLKWDRLFGGALTILGVDDGSLKMDVPLNKNNIRKLLFLKTYERQRVNWTTIDLYNDPRKPKYGEVEFYNIFPINGLPSFRVHESRCAVLRGVDIPEHARLLNNGWGAPYLQHCFEQLRAVGNIFGGLESIIEDFVMGTLSIKNLADLIYAGKESLVKDRLNMMDLSRHILNTVLLDADAEKYEKHASTVSGLSDIVDKFFLALSVVTGIPQRVLMGQQTGGLNNKGEGETTDWYNTIRVKQETVLKPVLEKVSEVIMLAKEGEFHGKPPADWGISFNDLEEMNEKQEAEIKKMNSETDKNYVDSGVLDAAEVALSRFGSEEYGDDIKLIADRTPAEELGGGAEPTEAEKLELEAQKKALEAPVTVKTKKEVKLETIVNDAVGLGYNPYRNKGGKFTRKPK
jgi:phage-related protein (TIGR01555 family)